MRPNSFKQMVTAAALALLIGFGLFTEGASARPSPASLTMQFRSMGRNDGSVRESGEDTYSGGLVNWRGGTIYVGDDYLRRQSYGFLDFDTSALPDDGTITGAYLVLKVTSFPTRYGNPYTLFGELYADIMPGYYGDFVTLESIDFDSITYNGWDYFSRATRAGDVIFINIQDFGSIDPTQHTQVGIYFFDNNNDALSQGLSFASGNHTNTNSRPLLTVFYDYP